MKLHTICDHDRPGLSRRPSRDAISQKPATELGGSLAPQADNPPHDTCLTTLARIDSSGGTKPLAVSIKEFCRIIGIGRTSAFKLIGEQKIEVRHVCGRTLVLMRSIEALLGLDGPGSQS